ncbi:prolyl endopeptidase [Plakobranchus ocellatus]|uniref:Prolyl endopeptidase n=1 Tax=Plakobranchus ocellatus TaxID=259542 RepID=A0AAV4AQ98_9GAST|nr:prolyl endopeptidase [Plakobranchus ocellatus]
MKVPDLTFIGNRVGIATVSTLILLVSLLLVFLVTERTTSKSAVMTSRFTYPDARRDESIVEDYHGTKIPDPYRWLEDPDAEETKAFVDAQNKISEPFFNSCPIKDKMQKRMTEVWDFPKYGCPSKHGSHYFYFHNSGLQNQHVMYIQDSLDAEPRVFLDPNKLSEDGTIAMGAYEFSEDGLIFAYTLSESGSDWRTIKFKESPSGKDLPDVLKRVKFSSLTWTHDHKGVFYNCYPKQDGKVDGTETTSNEHQKLFYHRIGTEQSEDVLVFEMPDQPKWMSSAVVTDDGKYLVLAISDSCGPFNRLFYMNLDNLPNGINGLLDYVKVVDNFEAAYEYVTNEGTVFTFKTNQNALNYKIINIDISKPEKEHWVELVPEDPEAVLEYTLCVNNDKLILIYLRDVKNEMYVYDLSSGKQLFQFPLGVGSITSITGEKKQTELFYRFTSFLTPGIIFHCDTASSNYSPKVFREIKVKNFDASKFETKQVFFKSKDGTKIPMFIVHKKSIPLDGNNPAVLYGYGGFSISESPVFRISNIMFLHNLNGVYAVANIRGGAEYGESWHNAGTLAKKQNGFDDFAAAAEYLIQEKYTNNKKLSIHGGSNGGLLVAASLNQRPDLFAAGVAQVGVLDMLRFHKFTIGYAWVSDYGSSDDPEQFQWLIKYSPLHNIKVPEGDAQYPAILLLTGDHDDRVVPLHSLKFAAQLQHTMKDVEKQTNPLLLRIDTKSGHGAGKSTTKIIEELVDIYSFLYKTIGIQWTD